MRMSIAFKLMPSTTLISISRHLRPPVLPGQQPAPWS
jgi:hypothetical protein